MKGHGCLKHYRSFYFTRILLYFANSLRIILAFLGDYCGVGLQLILTWLNVLLYYEKIPKKQDGTLVGRTPSFRGEYNQLFIHQLRAFLGYSNHNQIFLFKAFCFHNFSPLRKILAAPLKMLLNFPSIILVLKIKIFRNVKTLILLMLFLK